MVDQGWPDRLLILLKQVCWYYLVGVGFGIPVVLGLVAIGLELVLLFIYIADLLGLTEIPQEVVCKFGA